MFTPHPQKSATKSFSRHSKRFVPGRPWTPLDAPGRPCTPLYLNIIFKNVLKIFTPPSQKVLQNHFQVILSDLSLDAPVRPYAPVSKRVLLDEPGRRGVSPPPILLNKVLNINLPWCLACKKLLRRAAFMLKNARSLVSNF